MRSSDRPNERLALREVLGSATLAFPLVDDLSVLQDQFNVCGVLLLAFRAPHVCHSR